MGLSTLPRPKSPQACPENAVRAEANKSTMANQHFVKACENAGLPVTRRQASRWNMKKGKAYSMRNA